MEKSDTTNIKIEQPSPIHDKMTESNVINQKQKESFNDLLEASNTVNGETSEVEDFDISEAEEVPPPENTTLNIDSNARIVTKEVNCDNAGDDCDMQFSERSSTYFLDPRGSESGLHTSTEDLNVSDEEQSCIPTLQSINLDKLASTSSKKDSLSTSNFSHTVFKDEFSFEAEYLSDEEIRGALKEKSGGEDKLSQLNPALKLEGLLLTFRPPPSFFSPTTPDASDIFSKKNVSPNSMIDKTENPNFEDDQGSPTKTDLDLTKSEYSDDHNTDAEDISFGSLDDIIESSKNKNPFGKGYNAFSLPEKVSEFSSGNRNDDKQMHSDDSRRSTPEFLTDDETLTLENFSDHEKKRVKKFDYIAIDKNEKHETDEEDIEDQ